MRKLFLAAAVVMLAEALLIVGMLQQNQILQSKADGLREELARTTEIVQTRDAELQVFRENIAELQDGLKQANQTLSVVPTNRVEAPLASGRNAEPEPLGLTTNDVDLAGMVIVGTNTVGTLFVPIRGKVLERLTDIHELRQPLVFGTLLSDSNGWTGLGRWKRDGTNVHGIAIHFHSTAEAEAFASEMRAQVAQ